jgi:hypothetical protein
MAFCISSRSATEAWSAGSSCRACSAQAKRLFILLTGQRHLGLGTHLHDLRGALLFLNRLAHFRQHAVGLVVVAVQAKNFLQVKLDSFQVAAVHGRFGSLHEISSHTLLDLLLYLQQVKAKFLGRLIPVVGLFGERPAYARLQLGGTSPR